MRGAGKRKARPPVRFGDYQLDDQYAWSDHASLRDCPSPVVSSLSPPIDELEDEIDHQLAEVSRSIERIQLNEARLREHDQQTKPKKTQRNPPPQTRDIRQDDVPRNSRVRMTSPPRAFSRDPDSRTFSRDFGQDGRGAPRKNPSRRPAHTDEYEHTRGYPSLRDIRSMNYLQDPFTSAERVRAQPRQPPPGDTFGWDLDGDNNRRPRRQRDYSSASDDDDKPYRATAWRLLQQDTRDTQRSAFAASTQANHRTHFAAYLGFCEYFHQQPFPATPHLLSCYAQFLSRTLNSPASISHYISSVKLLHHLQGFHDLHLKHFELQQTLKGLKRNLQHRPRVPHPVTPEFLFQAHLSLDHSKPKDATIWAILLVGFFAYFRKSNLVPPTARAFKPDHHLCRRDILVAPEGLLIRTSWSKTIQANEREVLTPVLAIPGSPLCPVAAYRRMLHIVPASPDSPAFLLPSTPRRPCRPVTSSILEKAFAQLVASAGRPPGFHTLHDLRRGGYTLAFEAGVPRELRQRHGDWRSDADLFYLQPSMAQRLRLPAAMRTLILQRTT
ncbi:uncharacterized protein LOC144884601 [Branchiostoma floridae x Branchiostoma japonicum]